MTEILKSYCEKHYEIKKKLFIEIFHKMIIYKNVFLTILSLKKYQNSKRIIFIPTTEKNVWTLKLFYNWHKSHENPKTFYGAHFLYLIFNFENDCLCLSLINSKSNVLIKQLYQA